MSKKKFFRFLNTDKMIIFGLLFMFTILTAIEGHIWLAAIELAVTAGAFAFAIYRKRLRRAEINSILKSVTFYADRETLDTVMDFPLPALVLRPNGEVMWYNKAFKMTLILWRAVRTRYTTSATTS